MIRFEKFHGTGNDFFVVDATEPVADRRALAIDLCDRETGLEVENSTGADGVLFLALEDNYASPRVVMTLVQPDGSTAPMCGNGARCAAAWAARRLRLDEHERATPTSDARRLGRDGCERTGQSDGESADESAGETDVMIDTQAGTRRATIESDTDDEATVTIEMGTPRFAPESVPLSADVGEPLFEERVGELTVTAVNTGVPHAVAFVDDVATTDLTALAPTVRHADLFPRGTNVTLAAQRGDGRFDQRTYERGVEDETDACGTGAVAVAAVAREHGLLNGHPETISVTPPGGRLDIQFTDRGASLIGPAKRLFGGRVSTDASRNVEIDADAEAEVAGD